MNQEPIFILGAHKSGTSLLRSLFNGHSQLYTIPFETHYFQLANHWVDYEYRKQRPKNLNKVDFIQSFCSYIHTRNTIEDNLGGGTAMGRLNEQTFKENFSQLEIAWSDKQKYEQYIESIFLSETGKSINMQRVVEKSVINPEFASTLNKFFPKAKFIHIVRNPYSNIVSFRKFKSINGRFPALNRIIKSLYNSYYFLYKNQRTIENYTTIRYEDLLLNTEQEVRKLCDFLDLPFEKNMLAPTSNGKPWKGNSTTGEKFNAVDSRNIDLWKTQISNLEIRYINQFFPFVLSDYNYKKVETKKSLLRPEKKESLKMYVANRAIKYLF